MLWDFFVRIKHININTYPILSTPKMMAIITLCGRSKGQAHYVLHALVHQ